MAMPMMLSKKRGSLSMAKSSSLSGSQAEGEEELQGAKKRVRLQNEKAATKKVPEFGDAQRLLTPEKPIGQPWPVKELRAFDMPGDRVGWGQMLQDVLKARGWSTGIPCHSAEDEDDPGRETVWMKEFEACLAGQTPEEAFGKEGVVEFGYRLRHRARPQHALWMMGYANYRVPGTRGDRVVFREDFVKAVASYKTGELPGEPGNYRIASFPGTVAACYKTAFSLAFRDKPWYPVAYVLPKERDAFLRVVKTSGNSRSNYWIGKPAHEQGGEGIRVWRGTDPELIQLAKESNNGKSSFVIQRYLTDPLLIGGLKFHIRIHLLITNLRPLEAYVQDEGNVLFATKSYALSDKNIGAHFDAPMHVTNTGLNTKDENKALFMKKKPVIGSGQQLAGGMRALEAHLAKTHPRFDKRKLWGQIVQIGAETAQYIANSPSVRQYGKLVPDRHFENFGLDLMLDKDLKVSMCEVNDGPGLDYPDLEVLGRPNPDYEKDNALCGQTWHDIFELLGLDAKAKKKQQNGSLQNWYKVDTGD